MERIILHEREEVDDVVLLSGACSAASGLEGLEQGAHSQSQACKNAMAPPAPPADMEISKHALLKSYASVMLRCEDAAA